MQRCLLHIHNGRLCTLKTPAGRANRGSRYTEPYCSNDYFPAEPLEAGALLFLVCDDLWVELAFLVCADDLWLALLLGAEV